ncbi:alcohol dehydrogenase [Nocardioides sp. J9]|uniref:hypothetical protein n=1 Tax=Nocardioides sp. J9 TaxID=935844 RepID=UPI0011A7849D|nr:hypothetical protein [Nocardioides sp. J9]TWG96357.1 alcohol dehydrogenase [Nocardioides sp. J9]
MKAMVYRGPYRVRVEEKPRPRIEHPGDAKGGTVAVVGAYGPMFSLVKFGDALNKGLTMRMNQCPVKRQWPRLFEHIRAGHLRPSELVTRRIPLEHVAEGYHMFSAKLDDCIKPVITPSAA